MRPTDDTISSPANPKVKLVQTLRRRDVRHSERLFVVEGVRAVEDALEAGGRAAFILLRDGTDWTTRAQGVDVFTVTSSLFDRVAETETPQGVLGVFELPELPEPAISNPMYLLVDGIRDPGNLGTLLRSAAATGVAAVLIGPETVDPYNGKVVRSAVGAHFRVPLRSFGDGERDRIAQHCRSWILADASGLLTYDGVDWTGPAVLIVGSEAHGPSELGRSLATTTCAIPLMNGVESLNAGVAGSIMLFEAARQRRGRGTTPSRRA